MTFPWYRRRGPLTAINFAAIALLCYLMAIHADRQEWVWFSVEMIGLLISSTWLYAGRAFSLPPPS